MSSLTNLYNEANNPPAQQPFSMEEADDLIDALEHFLGDDEEVVSLESGLSDLFKERKESVKDKLQGLFKGSVSVQEGFTRVLKNKKESLKELPNEDVSVSFTGVASYFYDPNKKQYRTDITRAVKDDVNFIDAVFDVLKGVDKGVDDNLRLLNGAPTPRGDKNERVKKWRGYWEGSANAKIVSAGTVFLDNPISDLGLYNTRLKMASGFDPDKQNERLVSQTQHVKLASSKTKVQASAKRDIEDGLTLSKRDMDSFLDAALEFSDKTAEAVKLVERYGVRYHPRKGTVQKELVELESKMLEKISVSIYLSGIDVLLPANVSLITTMDTLPMQLVTRNLKLLRIFIRLSEQFFKD